MKANIDTNHLQIVLRTVSFILIFLIIYSPLIGQKVDIEGNAKIFGDLEVMDTIKFSDGTSLASACLQILRDIDDDTKVEVERSEDDDQIRFTVAGQEIMILNTEQLYLLHKGSSIFIGKSSGKEDLGDNENIFIGTNAGSSNTSGEKNVYLGHGAGSDDEVGFQNTYLGIESGSGGTGDENTYVGYQTGLNTNGQLNTVIGASAGEGLQGSKNVIIGSHTGKGMNLDNNLRIDNQDRTVPFISGNFNDHTLNFDADTKVERNLAVGEDIKMLELTPTISAEKGLKLGFLGEERFGIAASRFMLPPPSNISLDWLNIGPIINGSLDKTLNILQDGKVGIGTLSPATKFEVESSSPVGHIMKIENTAPGIEGDGLEIKLNRPTNGGGNNFVTFTGSEGVAGRIEGFNTNENMTFDDFPNIDFSLYFDVFEIENSAFTPGNIPVFTGGQLPTLSGGSFPTLLPGSLPTLNPGSFPTFNPGSFPTLSGGSFGNFSLNASFDGDAFVSNIVCGPFCADPQEVYTFNPVFSGTSFPSLSGGQLPSLSGGQLPSLTGGQLPQLVGGSFPTINPGSFPTLSGGNLPSFEFDFILDPSPVINALSNLSDVICWALENGERSLITTNPWDVSLQRTSGLLSTLANCKNGGVTYGSKGADYAEYLPRREYDEYMEAGQIVGIKGGMISKNTENADQLMVISMMPVVLGNMPDDSLSLDQYEKVAFLGQAPVWVVGKVRSGDYIIPSGNHDGYGLAVSPNDLKLEHLAQVVGRAWSDADQAVNLVNMAVGIKSNEMASILTRTARKVEEMDSRMLQIEAMLNIDSMASKN